MSDQNIREQVIEIVAGRFDADATKVTDTTSFVDDLGADSLDIAELVMEFEDKFDINIPDDEQGIKTIGETIAFITKAKA
ncbi:MAG: acyl carrier protein [Planctomycetes bacterium]|nr:acyl carrier protein [Planctomycetota bacterium]